MDKPSSVPSAYQMISSILKYCVPKGELNKILSQESLRFEIIIELLNAYFDEKMHFLEFFEKVNQPNENHYFLANAILNFQIIDKPSQK